MGHQYFLSFGSNFVITTGLSPNRISPFVTVAPALPGR
jgi:hypothetical protein